MKKIIIFFVLLSLNFGHQNLFAEKPGVMLFETLLIAAGVTTSIICKKKVIDTYSSRLEFIEGLKQQFETNNLSKAMLETEESILLAQQYNQLEFLYELSQNYELGKEIEKIEKKLFLGKVGFWSGIGLSSISGLALFISLIKMISNNKKATENEEVLNEEAEDASDHKQKKTTYVKKKKTEDRPKKDDKNEKKPGKKIKKRKPKKTKKKKRKTETETKKIDKEKEEKKKPKKRKSKRVKHPTKPLPKPGDPKKHPHQRTKTLDIELENAEEELERLRQENLKLKEKVGASLSKENGDQPNEKPKRGLAYRGDTLGKDFRRILGKDGKLKNFGKRAFKKAILAMNLKKDGREEK